MAASEPLTSWTRTLNEEDALALVDAAVPGTAVEAWRELGERLLPQASPVRRRELVRIVRDELLDVDAGAIADSAWLRLFRDGSPHRRLGLLYGRLWCGRPLVLRAVDELVHPALAQSDRPLAPHGSDLIEGPVWDAFLRRTLRPDVPSEAFDKTRTTLQGALRAIGVLEITGQRPRTFRVCRGRPDPLAFGWLLARELVDRGEESDTWAAHASLAARLFAPTPTYAESCLDAAATAGLVRRGHLMGQSRLQPGPEMR